MTASGRSGKDHRTLARFSVFIREGETRANQLNALGRYAAKSTGFESAVPTTTPASMHEDFIYHAITGK
jgi:hypothetical protein